MSADTVAVVRTGVTNLASVLAGLRRAGACTAVVNDPRSVANARHLVLPGVGSFEAAMTELQRLALVEPLKRRIRERTPTLAICLGMQLLGAGSEESPGVAGLGIVPLRAKRFETTVRVPQLGWNVVAPDEGCAILQSGHAYFANSYRFVEVPMGWNVAWADHGGRFVAAIEGEGVLGCQFHPELSGEWGVALLRRWLTRCPAETQAC